MDGDETTASKVFNELGQKLLTKGGIPTRSNNLSNPTPQVLLHHMFWSSRRMALLITTQPSQSQSN